MPRRVLLVGGFGWPPQVYARLARDVDVRVAPVRTCVVRA